MTTATERRLLVTMTREPFQPVRLYYAIPGSTSVINNLRRLKCMAEAKTDRCWQWLFHAESRSLRFSAGYDDVPREKRPIVLGRLRFPASGSMTLETNSIPRAVEAARFFAPRVGPEVVLMRCRIVNRFFAAEEGASDELLKTLDQGITVIDPRVAEKALERDFESARTPEDVERVAAERLERRLKSGEDVPMVEDFPLAPEEETPNFHHLETGLQFRFIRALEHWKGNTHLTLTAIIVRTVNEGLLAQSARSTGSV
jgi:hypothetical protein